MERVWWRSAGGGGEEVLGRYLTKRVVRCSKIPSLATPYGPRANTYPSAHKLPATNLPPLCSLARVLAELLVSLPGVPDRS